MANIFSEIGENHSAGELITEVMSANGVRIERIISNGEVSPENFWYDQSENEWVIVLEGKGIIEFDDGERAVLETGDYINIKAHKKHRVTFTSSPTIWLAVFYENEE